MTDAARPPGDRGDGVQGRLLRRPSASDVAAVVRLRGDAAVREFLGGPVPRQAALEKANGIVGSELHFVVDAAAGGRPIPSGAEELG